MPKAEQYESPVLAVDIGGTKITFAIITGGGQVVAEGRCPTLADEGVSAVINRLFSTVDSLLSGNNMEPSQLGGIGVAIAGAVNSQTGRLFFSANLPGWHDVPLGDMMRERYRVDAFLVNDANAAALGEYRFGAGKGASNLIMLTLGTGIGGGIIIDGKLYEGSCDAAGEIGHMVIDVNGPECKCGHRGCLEAMASGTAIARDAIERVRQGEKSSLVDMVGGKVESLTTEDVAGAARNGDSLALDVLTRAGTYLGVGMTSLVNIFDPEMIVLGGGMAELGDLFLAPAKRMVAEKAYPVADRAVRIVTAQLGNEAGLYGAAAYALTRSSGGRYEGS